MLAKLHESAFDDPDWVYEIKWDGYRAIADVGKDIKLYSRNGLDFSNDYPSVYEELKKIKKGTILDGEIVAVDAAGKPSFQLIQQYAQNDRVALCYYVFDCLAVGGKSIEDKSLLERKGILEKLLSKSDVIRYCDHISEQGKAFFKAMQQQGLEGMIAKRADSTYTEGARSNDWLKVKNVVMEEAVIAGYTEARGGRKFFGALVLGVYKKGKLIYIAHTGTGFNDKSLKTVYNDLQKLKTDKSPFDVKVPVNAPVTWVKPELVCNLKYSEITVDGHRRHPVFMGLRVDKAANEVHEEVKDTDIVEEETTDNDKQRVMEAPKLTGAKQVAFTHLDKVYWPDEGYTKGDVVNYYNTIYPYIGKYLKDRPESLLRTPNGLNDKGFFHKMPVW